MISRASAVTGDDLTGALGEDILAKSGFPITAFSISSALGYGRASTISALREGRSGLKACKLDLPFETVCGHLTAHLDPLPPQLQHHDTRITRLIASLFEGLADNVGRARQRWGEHRIGIFIGTSTAGIDRSEFAYGELLKRGSLPPSYDFVDQHAYHPVVSVLRALSGIRGFGYVLSTACSSSGKVFASADRFLRAGLLDAALIGGVDVLCQTTLRGFHSLGVLAPTSCRPFSIDRNGISIGEGGALLLLERSGQGLFRLLGVGESSDAYHISTPHPQGIGARLAMEASLTQAKLEPKSVSCINAHGTATPMNDAAEALAINAVFGHEIPVVSTKAQTGHLLGGAGAVEAVLAGLTLDQGFLPATLGAHSLDPKINLRVSDQVLEGQFDIVLSNSFAFGGNNVSLLLGSN